MIFVVCIRSGFRLKRRLKLRLRRLNQNDLNLCRSSKRMIAITQKFNHSLGDLVDLLSYRTGPSDKRITNGGLEYK